MKENNEGREKETERQGKDKVERERRKEMRRAAG